MYYKHKEWLEATKIDERINTLRKQRIEKKIEIYHLQYQRDRIYVTLGRASANLHLAKEEYEEIDTNLSMIDGRFNILAPYKPEKKNKRKPKKQSLKKAVKQLSKEERSKLIAELQGMK